MKLLIEVIIQPIVNIVKSWNNILKGNIISVAVADNIVEYEGYTTDYQNIKNDFQLIGKDIFGVMRNFDESKAKG